jgi:hypothetical protein
MRVARIQAFSALALEFLMITNVYGSQLDQIKQNAAFVRERFGPTSGIANFGCNSESMTYLDEFISRQGAIVKQDAQSTDRFVSLFGSFLGECILTTYGGVWVVKDSGIHIEVNANGSVNFLRPFHKVAKRIELGESESLLSYYRDLIPAALGPSGKP